MHGRTAKIETDTQTQTLNWLGFLYKIYYTLRIIFLSGNKCPTTMFFIGERFEMKEEYPS